MDGGLRHCSADSSHLHCLLSDSCSSSRGFATRFLQTPPRDGCPCVSLVLHLHQVGQGTCTPKLRNMPGKPKKAGVLRFAKRRLSEFTPGGQFPNQTERLSNPDCNPTALEIRSIFG